MHGCRTAGRAFNSWVAYWQWRSLKTMAAVHYYGRLLDRAWEGWRDYIEELEWERGMEANRLIVFKRWVLAGAFEWCNVIVFAT